MGLPCDQWIRKIGLLLSSADNVIDLSELHIKFEIVNSDAESPNNCSIRVYNLSQDTLRRIKGEFSAVTLNAGYSAGNFGVIFQGSIKQFRVGKENNVSTYLDILCADGDIGYNQGMINETLAKGHNQADILAALSKSIGSQSPNIDTLKTDKQHSPMPRGSVQFGMARTKIRNAAATLDASWSIQNGELTLIPNTGYLPGEAVAINAGTGMIGMPQQTGGGINLVCLLNSKLRIGTLVQLDNSTIAELSQRDPDSASIQFNQYAGIQPNTPLSPDGLYRLYVVEHVGDTRGGSWYSNLTCLAVDRSAAIDESVSTI
jgi:hypothetical protein